MCSLSRAAALNYRFFGVYDKDVSFSSMNQRRYVIDYYATAIFQGKWLGDAIHTLDINGVSVDPLPRGVLNRWDYWLFKKMSGAPVGSRASVLRFIDRWILKQAAVNSVLTRVMLREWNVSRWLAPVSDEAST